jgi:hypothetical protein
MTAGFVPPDHWTETAGQLRTSGVCTLDAAGLGTISFDPDSANQRWVITMVTVSTDQAADASLVPYATLALNTTDISQMSQGNNRGSTWSGNLSSFSGSMDVGPMDFASVLFYPPPGTVPSSGSQVTYPSLTTYPGPAMFPGANSEFTSALAGVIASAVVSGTKYTRRR